MARRRATSAGMAGLGLAWTVPPVMGLRIAKIARGGKKGEAESRLMVTEKLAAAAQAQGIMARAMMFGSAGKGADQVMRLFSRKVAANLRRLSKG